MQCLSVCRALPTEVSTIPEKCFFNHRKLGIGTNVGLCTTSSLRQYHSEEYKDDHSKFHTSSHHVYKKGKRFIASHLQLLAFWRINQRLQQATLSFWLFLNLALNYVVQKTGLFRFKKCWGRDLEFSNVFLRRLAVSESHGWKESGIGELSPISSLVPRTDPRPPLHWILTTHTVKYWYTGRPCRCRARILSIPGCDLCLSASIMHIQSDIRSQASEKCVLHQQSYNLIPGEHLDLCSLKFAQHNKTHRPTETGLTWIFLLFHYGLQ